MKASREDPIEEWRNAMMSDHTEADMSDELIQCFKEIDAMPDPGRPPSKAELASAVIGVPPKMRILQALRHAQNLRAMSDWPNLHPAIRAWLLELAALIEGVEP